MGFFPQTFQVLVVKKQLITWVLLLNHSQWHFVWFFTFVHASSPQVAGVPRFRFGPPEDMPQTSSSSHSDLGQLASQGGTVWQFRSCHPYFMTVKTASHPHDSPSPCNMRPLLLLCTLFIVFILSAFRILSTLFVSCNCKLCACRSGDVWKPPVPRTWGGVWWSQRSHNTTPSFSTRYLFLLVYLSFTLIVRDWFRLSRNPSYLSRTPPSIPKMFYYWFVKIISSHFPAIC